MAHAWIDAHVTAGLEERFLRLRQLERWNDHDDEWEQRGTRARGRDRRVGAGRPGSADTDLPSIPDNEPCAGSGGGTSSSPVGRSRTDRYSAGIVIDRSDIHPILLGHFTLPDDGDPRAGEKVVVCAYLIDHPDGPVLLDTGIAEGHEETEHLYRPVRRSLDAGLASAGASVGDVRAVVNCHFHIDHSGNNPRFAGTPIFAQQTEFDAAHGRRTTRSPSSTTSTTRRTSSTAARPTSPTGSGSSRRPATPPGISRWSSRHRQGRVVLAGQAVNGATDFARAHFAQGLRDGGSDEEIKVPTWIERIRELDPVEVLFAHDTASWHRDR